MKVAVIFYHKNHTIYEWKWLEECILSILKQSYKDFIIYELNYDGGISILSKFELDNRLIFFNKKLDNHADAMNFLLDKCVEDKIDYVFNTNIDDSYHLDRIKIQLKKLEEGYDIVSSNFILMNKDNDKMIMNINDINDSLTNDHNIIAHPSVCYSKKFIKNNRYVSSDIPKEDLLLWKKTINKYKFFICEEFLLNYRIHNNQVSTLPKIIPTTIDNINFYQPPIINQNLCVCGEPKNKVRYNFCQKCNKFY
jgi:hypothetical protein